MMKPNNKAIEAGVKICWDCPRATPSMIRDILTAAYAAQFQSDAPNALKKAWICYRLCEGGGAYDGPFFVKYEPEEGDYDKIEPILYYDAAQFQSEDYAELIETLRSSSPYTSSHVAADVLEALLAERDGLLAENTRLRSRLESFEAIKQMGNTEKLLTTLRNNYMRRTREMLKIKKERDTLAARLAPVDDEALEAKAAAAIIAVEHNGIDDEFILEARAVIAAIRPHIKAAERERCVKAVKTVAKKINVAPHERPAYEDGYLQGVHDAAAEIRSGK